jgi:glyceraldehyde 3-phosphate dehydrogenase
MLPASTGAALATTKALPGLAVASMGWRCASPFRSGRSRTIILVGTRPTTVDGINDVLRDVGNA